jgi:hypothetical protein
MVGLGCGGHMTDTYAQLMESPLTFDVVCQRLSNRPKFLARIAPSPNGCWLWTGKTGNGGYGRFRFNDRGSMGAHRFLWISVIGPIAPGLQLDHLCRVRHCVNPAHLEPVTAKENQRRGTAAERNRMRRRPQCMYGHSYTVENTGYTWRGKRYCKQCSRDRASYRKRVAQ